MSPVFDVDPGEASVVAPKVAAAGGGDAGAKTGGAEEKKNEELTNGVNKGKKDKKRKAATGAEPALVRPIVPPLTIVIYELPLTLLGPL